MNQYETLSCVHGYHEYHRVWIAAVGEELWCVRERPQNPTDPNAVIVKKDGITVNKAYGKFLKCLMLLIIDKKNFMCLIFAVWLNRKT